ncbi:hypothetical protein GCM10009599_27810 [Luteococcus peritonei]
MGALSPALRLDELSLPGTHDSGATLGGRWVACQELSISRQLELGVRYLDIRLSLQRGHFRVHHNQWFQQLTLDEVLQACRDFLALHPTECVLLCLTQEYRRRDLAQLSGEWARVRHRFRDLLLDRRRVPSLGRARGRVVVVTRDGGFAGLEHADWSVHDDWHVASREHWQRRKWPAVTDHLRRARAARGDGRMWSCHATSNGWRLPPREASRLLNPALATHFAELGPRPAGATLPERNGVILLDFPDEDLLAAIWRRNLPGRAQS